MQAHVNKDLCIGCGLCESICPEVFKMEDDGSAVAYVNEVDAAAEANARDAAAQCPTEAISAED